MNSSLKEVFERVGPIRTVAPTKFGSRAVLVLRPRKNQAIRETVSAVLSLAHRGVTFAKGKRAVEDAMRTGRAVVLVPSVEDPAALSAEMERHGFEVAMVVSDLIDIKVVRERLGLTQEQFALRFGLDLDSVQNWESGRRTPDLATRSYLRVINRLPELASEALEEAPVAV